MVCVVGAGGVAGGLALVSLGNVTGEAGGAAVGGAGLSAVIDVRADEELVDRAAHGDRDAFEVLYGHQCGTRPRASRQVSRHSSSSEAQEALEWSLGC